MPTSQSDQTPSSGSRNGQGGVKRTRTRFRLPLSIPRMSPYLVHGDFSQRCLLNEPQWAKITKTGSRRIWTLFGLTRRNFRTVMEHRSRTLRWKNTTQITFDFCIGMSKLNWGRRYKVRHGNKRKSSLSSQYQRHGVLQ